MPGRDQHGEGRDMVYEVPKSKASVKQNRFEFKIDGHTYSVPLLKYIPGTTVERMAKLEQAGGMQAAAANYQMFGDAGTPVGDAVRTLDGDQLGDLANAWAEASGISVGESEAS